MLRSFINTLLALLFFIACFLFFLADAVAQEVSCQIGIESGDRHWSGTVFGDAPYICTPSSSGGLCRYDLKGVSLCFVATAECVGNFISTGQACNWDDSAGLKQGGQTVYPDYSAPPDKPWDPNNPSLPLPKKVENVINQMPSNVEHGVDEAKAYRSLAQMVYVLLSLNSKTLTGIWNHLAHQSQRQPTLIPISYLKRLTALVVLVAARICPVSNPVLMPLIRAWTI